MLPSQSRGELYLVQGGISKGLWGAWETLEPADVISVQSRTKNPHLILERKKGQSDEEKRVSV